MRYVGKRPRMTPAHCHHELCA